MLFIDPFFFLFFFISLGEDTSCVVLRCGGEGMDMVCGLGLAEWNPRWESTGIGENRSRKERVKRTPETTKTKNKKEEELQSEEGTGGVRGTAFDFDDVAFVIFSLSSLLTTIFLFLTPPGSGSRGTLWMLDSEWLIRRRIYIHTHAPNGICPFYISRVPIGLGVVCLDYCVRPATMVPGRAGGWPADLMMAVLWF